MKMMMMMMAMIMIMMKKTKKKKKKKKKKNMMMILWKSLCIACALPSDMVKSSWRHCWDAVVILNMDLL